jgi:hypothetical protein
VADHTKGECPDDPCQVLFVRNVSPCSSVELSESDINRMNEAASKLSVEGARLQEMH